MKKLSLPKQNNYEVAYDRAVETLAATDPALIRERTGADAAKGKIVIPYFDQTATLTFPGNSGVSSETEDGVRTDLHWSGAEVKFSEKILILHYLTTLGSGETKGELIPFKRLPGASFYNATYRKRGPNIIRDVFGYEPEKLLAVIDRSCVQEGSLGDVCLKIQVFPKIEAVVVLHKGDDEFPPECTILYSDVIENLLPLEDVAVLAGRVASKLMKWAG